MPFNRKPQKFNASINAVELGTGDKAIQLGGQNVLPFYGFDGSLGAGPKIGVEFSDLGLDEEPEGVKAYYEGCTTFAEIAKRAAEMPGADFVTLRLEGGDPNGQNKSIEELLAVVKEVADAIDVPLVVEGCKNVEKDGELLPKVAEMLDGRNILLMSAKEENYKTIGVAGGLAYKQKVGAESAVDINLAKQLNVLISQMGIDMSKIVMDLGSAAAGYGFEYLASTIERVKNAALTQNDAMLQMPVFTMVGDDAWSVKEALLEESEAPEWGPREERGIQMEIVTASAALASGTDCVILKHPDSVKTISELIAGLM